MIVESELRALRGIRAAVDRDSNGSHQKNVYIFAGFALLILSTWLSTLGTVSSIIAVIIAVNSGWLYKTGALRELEWRRWTLAGEYIDIDKLNKRIMELES